MGKEEQFSQNFIVKQTGAAYGVGVFIIASAVVLLTLEIRYHVRAIPIWIYLMIAGILLLGIYVWMEAWNRRLMVMEDTLYYRNVLGKMIKFSIEDIGYGKAAYHASKGRDYLRLYDKEGKLLCRLECSMRNVARLVWYLHDNDIPMELEKGAEGFAGHIVSQSPISEEEMKKLSQEVYGQAQTLVEEWQERNEELEAEFDYGFACYCMEKMGKTENIGKKVQTQSKESRYFSKSVTDKREMELLPKDYLCRLELYVKKEGYPVQDRRGRLMMLEIPIFYRKKSEAQREDYRLYYNGSWADEMKEDLQWLEIYLPRHRFVQLQEMLEYELEKTL